MEKKLVKEINIKVNSNQKKIRGSIFLNSTKLKKNNIVKSGQKISGKISLKKISNIIYKLYSLEVKSYNLLMVRSKGALRDFEDVKFSKL